MTDLTESQRKLLHAMKECGDDASYKSVGEMLGITANAVVKGAKRLETKGYIRLKKVHRFFELTPKANGPDSMLQLQS